MNSSPLSLLACGALLVAATPAVLAKKDLPAAGPKAATTPTAPATKPEVQLPLSPNSGAAAQQIASVASAAGAILGPRPGHETLSLSSRVIPLPPRDPKLATTEEKLRNLAPKEHDVVALRWINDRYWLITSGYLMVSEPGDPSRWPLVRPAGRGTIGFLDVFSRDKRTWLLSKSWLAEVSPDGRSLLNVPHRAPMMMMVERSMDQLAGKPFRRGDPLEFEHVAVWGNQAWLTTQDGAVFTHGDRLGPALIPNLGRNPDLHPFGKELVVFSQGGRRLHRTGDGRTWIERQPTRDLDTGAGIQLAQGQRRFVHADSNGIRYSADGVVWQEMREPIVPSMKIEIRNPDGTYRQVPRDVQWCHAQYADPFFVLVGGTWEPNRRYESGSPDPDQTVVAFSADGIHWKSARVAAAPAREWRGVGAQGRGKVLLTHAKGSRETLELDLFQELRGAVLGRHPIGYGYLQAGLHREIDEALARRDGRTAVRALVELEKFYPSEAALRYSAIVRAQLGDLDGAWTALATLETLAPDDVELAVLRGTVLQGSGRVAEAQAYARWFLAQKQAPWPQEPALALKAKLARFQLMLGSGDVAQATGFAENEVQRDKTNVEFRIMLAMVALQKGDAATARRWLTEAAAQGDARAQQMLSRLPP